MLRRLPAAFMSIVPPIVDAAPSQRAALASPWAALRWLSRALLGVVLAAWSLLLIAWLILHWGILPHIERWKPQIEARASQALGVPLRIGGISVTSSGWVPALELRDVSLLDARQQPALVLPRVAAAVSPRSLLTWQLRFEQLLIEGAQLEVRRDPQGRLFVAGLEFGGAPAGEDTQLADWFFTQHEFVIRHGTLRWTDELQGAPTLTLTDVQLLVRNGLRQHTLRLDATPDAAWGERFTLMGRFTQPLLARGGDWRRWSGQLYASAPRVDVSELRRHLQLPFELTRGDGALRGWFELRDGQPRAATVDVALQAVSLRLGAALEALDFAQVEGRLVAQRNDDGMSLALQRFGFVTGDGIRWPRGDLAAAWRQRSGQPASGGEFSAQRLDLGLMAQVASRVPLGEAVRKLLGELAPQGVVSDLAATWDGPLDAPTRYQAKATLSGLTLASRPSAEPGFVGRPGLRDADLQITASEVGGQAQLRLNGGAVELPGVFEEALLPLDTLDAQLAWKIEAAKAGAGLPKVSVQVKSARFANADAQGELSATWSTGPGAGLAKGGRYPGLLELDGKLADGVAARTARYLPLGIPAGTRGYVERAVRSGKLASATFRVKGDLWDFPFYTARNTREGEFRIAARMEDVGFAYVPSEPALGDEPAWVSPWPALSKVSGDLVIDRNTLEVRNAQAQLGNLALSKVQAGIASLADRSVLTVDGTARGPLADMLRFVNATPVGAWTGQALARATASGPAELKLGLNIPLWDVSTTTVKGSVALTGNDLRISPDTPLLGAAKGRVDFSQKGFAVVGASARVLGGDATFEGGAIADGSLRFTGQGTASAEGLRRASELGWVSKLAGSLSGQAAYRMTLGFVHGLPEFNITSNLVGLAADLPAPLRKAAETPLALRYQTTLAPDSLLAGQVPRDTLRVELGTLLQASYQRELDGELPRVLRGGLGVGDAAPTPAIGVAALINLAALDTQAWEAVSDQLFGIGATAGDGSDTPSPYAPDRIGLRVQQLNAGSRQLSKVVAGLTRVDGAWRANVDADQLSGHIEYRAARPGNAGRVYARLSRLSLPKSDSEAVDTLLDQPATSVPALDIVVDDFELRGKRLGRVEVEALNRSAPASRDGAREWRLSKLNVTVPEAQFSATGQWADAGGGASKRRATLDFKLAVSDAGALLERLGTGKAIRGGKGQLGGQVSWLGSPLALDYASLGGNVNVAIDAGQFLKADAGATKLLGVLSLQSLPRRLVLDFRDVFQEGFAFDSITGDLKIAQGVATTNNLRMRGVQAAVLMEGSADIDDETQDLHVLVVPEINAGTASLVYAAINPAIGLGTFLAQAFLRKPLMQAGTREFHVTGPWADPKVDKIERKPGDPLPNVDAALGLPAAPASGVPGVPGVPVAR